MSVTVSESLADLLEEGKTFAEAAFESEGHVSATALVVTDTEALLISMDPSEGPVTKQEFRSAIQEAVTETEASGVCIIAEIWYDTLPIHAAANPVAERPTRREGLLVCAEDASGETVCLLSAITREESGASVGEWKVLGNIDVSGTFTGFFKSPARPQFLN